MAAETEATGGRRETINGLARGLAVIKALGQLGTAGNLTEIAQAAQLHAAVARRCLHTLEDLGYVGRAGRRFFLRPRILELGTAYLDAVDSEALVRDYLSEIVAQSGHSSSLTVLDGHDIVYLAHVGPRRVLRLEASVGTRYPAYPTSMGRALLSGLPDDQIRRYVETAEIRQLTRFTVTDPERLVTSIRRAREDGFSCVEDELAIGVIAIAVPVFDRTGRVVASINCSAQSGETGCEELVSRHLPLLREVAARISSALAHIPGLSDGHRPAGAP
ncbi:MAG TPA: IclR family transcriptional regulator C-terminal domain-containing protein [Stellaceae bacterium]|nr:IclR family transcriptional regulator C-terminal domain-containing protein [Stellaceae bacterium]